MNTVHSMSFGDTETLDLNPTCPHEVALESIGAVSLKLEHETAVAKDVPLAQVFAKYLAALCSDEVVGEIKNYIAHDAMPTMSVSPVGYAPVQWASSASNDRITVAASDESGAKVTVSLFDVRPSIIEQLGYFRRVSENTLAFHKKNGRNLDSHCRVGLASAMKRFSEVVSGSSVVFYRGTDFDGPLIASICKDLELPLPYRGGKHNLLRDVRTALDENIGGDFVGFMDSKCHWMAAALNGEFSPELTRELDARIATVRSILTSFDGSRHSALIDSYFDAVQYCLTKYVRLLGGSMCAA